MSDYRIPDGFIELTGQGHDPARLLIRADRIAVVYKDKGSEATFVELSDIPGRQYFIVTQSVDEVTKRITEAGSPLRLQ